MDTPRLWTVTGPLCRGMALLWTVTERPHTRLLSRHTRLLCHLTAPLPMRLLCLPMALQYLSVSAGDSSSAEAPPVTKRITDTRAVTAEWDTMLLSQVTAPPVSREHSTQGEAEVTEEAIKERKQSS